MAAAEKQRHGAGYAAHFRERALHLSPVPHLPTLGAAFYRNEIAETLVPT